MSVAIVDDDVPVATALKGILDGLGYDVAALAHTCADGLALADRPGAFEIMFVDLVLDGTSGGTEVVQRAVRHGLDVVVMTGGAIVPDALPGVGLLMKPFSTDQVKMLLDGVRQRRRQAGTS